MTNLKIFKSYNIARHTNFKIGGKALFYCEPASADEIQSAYSFAEENRLQVYVIGGGSNILVSDAGINGIVLSTKKLNKIKITGAILTADSGAAIKEINKKLKKASLSGMEFTSGLPGSIGGAVYMNARAYGKEISQVIQSVTAIDSKGKIFRLKHNDLKYSYKKSFFMKKKDLIILSASFNLKKGDGREISELYREYYKDRLAKCQFKYPSAGCVFKNDSSKNIIAGKLIDELGLKQKRIGGAEVSKNHANFIINKHKAKASDVLKLIEFIEKKAYEEKGIKLEREVELLGF
jgi:UDP-N-acetylmuramate dehydrogenase